MVRIEEVIIVEGRYDKNTLRQVVDAVILETSGFGIFHDKEKRKLFLKLAEQRGLILLTDSDGAGFVIRNYLKSFLPPDKLKQAYIPDLYGKEVRAEILTRLRGEIRFSCAGELAEQIRRDRTEKKFTKQAKTFLSETLPFTDYLPSMQEPKETQTDSVAVNPFRRGGSS